MYANTRYNAKAHQGQGYQEQGHQSQGQGYHGEKCGNSKKKKSIYTYCGLIGHIANKCYKFHGYPLSYNQEKEIAL